MSPIAEEIEPYKKYAKYYDLLLGDIRNYDDDCNFVEHALAQFGYSKPVRILDIGCGTGEHATRLVKRGYQTTGIDASEEMIEQAIKKAQSAGVRVDFFVQDMRRIKLNRVFDCAISISGPFSRLMGDEDFGPFFEGLNSHLRSGGLFIFDFINTQGVMPGHKDWKVKENGNLIVIRLDRADFQGENNLLEEHHEFFMIETNKLTDSWDEIHKLRTHRLDEIKAILQKYGFALMEPPAGEAEKEDSAKPEKPPFGIRVVARKSN